MMNQLMIVHSSAAVIARALHWSGCNCVLLFDVVV